MNVGIAIATEAGSLAGIGKETRSLSTLRDLLNAMKEGDAPNYSMLGTAARHICGYFHQDPSEIPIGRLAELSDFPRYLFERKHTPETVHTYHCAARKLYKIAHILGWSPFAGEVGEQWKPLLDAISDRYHGRDILELATTEGVTPDLFSEAVLVEWQRRQFEIGRSPRAIKSVVQKFRQTLRKQRLCGLLPRFNCSPKGNGPYAVSLREMPLGIREEILLVLSWKQDRYAPGRPKRGRLRPITAGCLRQVFERLFGFARRECGIAEVSSIRELVTPEILSAYTQWQVNVRGLLSYSISRSYGMLSAALKHHPKYGKDRFAFIDRIIAELPADSESEKQERKAKKYLPYDTVAGIPGKLHFQRHQVRKWKPCKLARIVQGELLITWLLTLPWRQRNLRECRIGSPETANLFKAPLPQLTPIAVPEWVQKVLDKDPKATFWQFFFRENETKVGHEARGVLPRNLIGLLDEYLKVHRPQLVKDSGVSTLFVNNIGNALSQSEMQDLVSKLTLRFAGRIVTPHIFRDIVAYKWLEDHPQDYLTVSKLLWHQNIQTTLRIYGRRYDESHAAMKIDEWLQNRN